MKAGAEAMVRSNDVVPSPALTCTVAVPDSAVAATSIVAVARVPAPSAGSKDTFEMLTPV